MKYFFALKFIGKGTIGKKIGNLQTLTSLGLKLTQQAGWPFIQSYPLEYCKLR